MLVVNLCLFFEIISIAICLHWLYGEPFKLDIKTMSMMAIDIIWMQAIYYFQLPQSMSSLIYPVIAVYCGLRFGFKLKTIIINNILYMIILGGMQFVITFILYAVFHVEEIHETGLLVINLFILLVMILALKKFDLKKLSDILHDNERIIVISLGVIFSCILFCLLQYKFNSGFNLFYLILLVASIVLICFAVEAGKHKIKAREMEAEIRLHKLYEESFQHLIEDICAKQHEFDNHINTIYGHHYLYKTYEELIEAQKEYCQEIVNENHHNKLLSKGNATIIGFLYGKLTEIEKQGIKISYKVSIEELRCGVPVYKIVELLGNLINNAVDATKEGEEIRLILLEKEEEIYIEVANESEIIDYNQIQQFFEKGYSEKGENRGFGLYNVRKICEEYKIEIQCFNQEINNKNWITFALAINKPL